MNSLNKKRSLKILAYILFPVIVFVFSCQAKKEGQKVSRTEFVEIKDSESGILFTNTIVENDTFNYFKFPYMYMGGGVAIGDINNDGLSDLFLTGNMVSNKLYLNKGDMQFDDITAKAGVTGDGKWNTGVTMTDINNDGFLDIYVCVSGIDSDKENLLFINNGDDTFTESAAEYGINDNSNSIQATFFDYDNDGDIDLFVANYALVPISQGNLFYDEKMRKNDPIESGHLYRNEGDGKFSDVTLEAGVQNFSLTLGIVASDFNNDGWQDLYLSNDFNVPDYFYINNHDGTFREVVKDATGHVSMFGMGIDAADFNNDGFIDLIQSEMSPEDYVRARVNMASMDPESFYQSVALGMHYQYMQNSLQLNNGINAENIPVMSEISRFAKMASTDWSWSALFADLDNDGWKDIYITNGTKRDVNDNDVNNRSNTTSFRQAFNFKITDYKSEPLANYVYKNKGGYAFEKVGEEWKLDAKGFSNGMTYGDLDNDGDLDLVINNIDQKASLYRNDTEGVNYLRVALKGPEKNPLGLGAKVTVIHDEHRQIQEMTLTRGFQSSVEPILHFGMGDNKIIDTLKVDWPDGTEQIIINPEINKLTLLEHSKKEGMSAKENRVKNIINDITAKSNIDFAHEEDLYDDYQLEPLIPYRYSMLGATIAVGDVNGDGLEDFYAGNAAGSKSALYLQNEDATFQELNGPWSQDAGQEDLGALFYDFDNDGDLDLYVASGGSPNQDLTDRLYVNTEEGFIKSLSSLPQMSFAGQSIAISDFDHDGLMDVFVGGRNTPGKYPYPTSSVLLRNLGGKDRNLKFERVEKPFGNGSNELGMVTDAVWADLDGDGWEDLILAGEWMPITVFKNNKGKLEDWTDEMELLGTDGWWYSLRLLDVDLDGDLDIVAGNLGLNYKYQASDTSPFKVYSTDFDENGSNDIVLSYKKNGRNLPLRGRECSSQQVPAIAKRYGTFVEYANADLEDIYGEQMLENSLHYQVTSFAHSWFENVDGKFQRHNLPPRAQLSVIKDIEVIDYNKDEFPDLLLFGNLYQAEVETPRGDAGVGLILVGSKDGYMAIEPSKSGLFIRGDIKSVVPIKLANNNNGFLLGANDANLRLVDYKPE
tara:strand:- start:8588 stop:11899 length:3312 start_codon:yes stop_codon:yes gene_type:complete